MRNFAASKENAHTFWNTRNTFCSLTFCLINSKKLWPRRSLPPPHDRTLQHAGPLLHQCRTSLIDEGLNFAAQQKGTWWREELFCRRREKGSPHSRATADALRVAGNPVHISSRHKAESLPEDESPARTPSLLASLHRVICLHLLKAGQAAAKQSRFVRTPHKPWQAPTNWENAPKSQTRFWIVSGKIKK